MDFMERALSENSGARAIAGLCIHARSDPGVIYPPTGTSFREVGGNLRSSAETATRAQNRTGDPGAVRWVCVDRIVLTELFYVVTISVLL